MSENKHTPEPWSIDPDDRPNMHWNNHIVSDENPNIAICFMAHDGTEQNECGEANARRIVACVNACAGVDTEFLEVAPIGIFASKYGSPGYIDQLEKQRDELLSDLAEAKRSAEFNFEQYQDVGRLLHEECEKTEKLLAAMIHIQQVACSGSPELGIATDAIANVKGEQ